VAGCHWHRVYSGISSILSSNNYHHLIRYAYTRPLGAGHSPFPHPLQSFDCATWKINISRPATATIDSPICVMYRIENEIFVAFCLCLEATFEIECAMGKRGGFRSGAGRKPGLQYKNKGRGYRVRRYCTLVHMHDRAERGTCVIFIGSTY
jgi:hypothetical protein